jgi:hypothetical protein
MNRGGTLRPHLDGRNSLAPDSPGYREVGRGVIVEILLGGFRIPGIVDYTARGEHVTFRVGSSSRAPTPERS